MRIRPWLFFSLIILLASCKDSQEVIIPFVKISGKTMGTTYHITLQTNQPARIKKEVDQLLIEINLALSTYIPESTISQFNNDYAVYRETELDEHHDYFIDNYKLAKEIHEKSGGAFEPTLMPIVNYWGFGYSSKEKVVNIDTARIEQLMKLVGFSKVSLEQGYLEKSELDLELDFSGIAKGYGVDLVSRLLEEQSISNFYVEIGGEVYATGVNASGHKWRTGISIPKPNVPNESIQQIVEISGLGIATSGNYENYYSLDEGEISHTINPQTGFPERTRLLSATIMASNCATADGFATASMVLGLDKSIEMINLQEEIEGILIFTDENDSLQVFNSTKN